jgi:methionine aminopeptidase
VTAELDGFYADACTTVVAGPAAPRARKLIAAADGSLAAHTEHTIVVTGARPLVLTA